jgi:hypothetical protein
MKTVRVIRYVDPNQNVYYFEEEPRGTRNPNVYYGTIIRIRPGWAPNIHEWKVGDSISVTKCVCVIESHMNYKVETHFGCTSDALIVNDKNYYGEDPRYHLNDQEREQFNDALLAEIGRRFHAREIGPTDLLSLLPSERYEVSDTCEQCGDSVTSTYYSF